AASEVSAASTTIPAASATIPAAKPTISAAAPTVVAAYTRRRKGVIIKDPKEELSLKTSETPAETPKVNDKGKAEDLRKLLEVVEDEDDDVFVKATPLASKNQMNKMLYREKKSVHGLALVKRWKLLTSCGVHIITLSTVQLFLLVEKRYLLLRFTLEQLVNVARLQVKEESEMSLELLRFTRQQL
nr:hypothetical protein [Tanacetum cinerariifolium]